MPERELMKLSKATTVNSAGELMVNAGKYSRGAVVCAFEMMGGIEAFAQWATENETDFYTKMFTKVIGREVEHKSADGLEDMLTILDAEAVEEIEVAEIIQEPAAKTTPGVKSKMAMAAEKYAQGEPTD